MKIIDIDVKLKPLYANLKRLHIGKYLNTREFELFVLERSWDTAWVGCRNRVDQHKRIFGVISIDEDEREESFCLFSAYCISSLA